MIMTFITLKYIVTGEDGWFIWQIQYWYGWKSKCRFQ